MEVTGESEDGKLTFRGGEKPVGEGLLLESRDDGGEVDSGSLMTELGDVVSVSMPSLTEDFVSTSAIGVRG